MDLIKIAEQAFAQENAIEIPSFNTGDTISVHYKIKEGNKERIQIFKGVVIQIKGTSLSILLTFMQSRWTREVLFVDQESSISVNLPERKQKLKRRNFNLSFSYIKKASFDTRLFLFPQNFFAET